MEAAEVYAWRKPERERLIALRLQLSADDRKEKTVSIAAGLDQAIGDVRGKAISLYWPFRGEPDLRPWIERIVAAGATCLLPVVVAKHQPLIFKSWRPGEKLDRGVWNIPFPAEGREMLPDVVIAPLVGYDPSFYRLGYGGGFFDRTLAAHPGKPTVIGVGYAIQRLSTIYPQAHDIPMTHIITEEGPL